MDDKGAIDRLHKKLNSRNGGASVRRSSLRTRTSSTKRSWEKGNQPHRKVRRINWVEFAFIGSIVFFLGAALFAGFLFFSGSNTVSTRNVDITIDGPTEIRAGDVLPLQIVITNRNSVPMELTDLVVEFPSGTRSETDVTVELPRIRESLGTIDPGESVNRTIRAIMFGQADTKLNIDVSVEYRVPSSNAIFFSENTYTLPISQSPASITVESLKEIISGQETALTVTVTSNVSDVLSNILLVAEYSPGFSYKSSSPQPLSGTDTWRLGDIEPNGKRTVTIRGTFSGEDGDERVIHFTAGTQKGTVQDEIAAPLATGDVALNLAKPFVSLSLSLDGNVATEHTAQRGVPVRGDIRWTNNLPTRAQDVEIQVQINGEALNRNSVVGERGFWRSQDNTLVWSRETDSSLADVAPGATGVLSFSFTPRATDDGVFRNPEINLSAVVKARRATESRVPEVVESSTSARVLVQTDLALKSTLTHTGGSKPPKADTTSSYMVTWNVTNTSNALANTSVTATLPSYVTFKEGVTGGESITYSTIGGALTWNIGDLEPGASRTVSFRIDATPSLSQVGQTPTLVSDQRVFGFDRFTRTNIERTTQPLTTRSSSISTSEGTVVP